ncbi:MAG: putative O-glycosylation ligase, exosortase A system-associated [Pseudomonadota bacterium]
MRDIVLLAIFPLFIFAILKRPFIGLGMWVWTALFNPNGWVYGAASSIRYNLIFAGLTIGGYLISGKKKQLQLGVIGWLIILFLAWTALSTFFAKSIPDLVLGEWLKLLKIILLFIFILLIIEKKIHIDFFLWCLILSVGFFASLEGLKYIASGGGHRIEGLAGHILQDNNQLALAFTMLLPICFYMLGEYGKQSRVLKFGLLGLIILVVTAIIGTNSRGGLLALSSVGGYLFIKSEKKLLFILIVICIGSVLVGFIPERWFARMDTIAQADGDASFMGRVVAWKLSFILASQNPFLGGGFKGLEYFPVWTALSEDFGQYPFFYSGNAFPDPRRSHAAHSIYFQVLGDHGFVGLIIFLMVLILSFFKAGKIAKAAKNANGPEWIINLATMLRLSIFTYAIGGAALSFAYFDMIYAIYGLVLVLANKFIPNLTNNQK